MSLLDRLTPLRLKKDEIKNETKQETAMSASANSR
jgi:hypothetical protein